MCNTLPHSFLRAWTKSEFLTGMHSVHNQLTTPAVAPSIAEMPTEFPSMQPTVCLGFTILCTVLYAALFFAAYWQLWLILYYQHRRLSYHTVFLSMCLVYAALRIVLFSFYYSNVIDAALLPVGWNWLLYSFPICIQFAMLCLLILYFMQMLLQARARFGDSTRRQERAIRVVILMALLLFLGISLLTAWLNARCLDENYSQVNSHYVIMLRMLMHEGLFVIAGTSLAVSVFKLLRMSTANILLEAKGASLMQAFMVAFCTVFLYMSRAIYNFAAVVYPELPGFNYGWTNVSDQADLVDLANGYTYVAFGIVLIIWEFMPTSAVLMFFRVHKPVIEPISIEYSVNLGRSSQAPYRTLFDNPAHYDSDDDEFGSSCNLNNTTSLQVDISNGATAQQSRAHASLPFGNRNSRRSNAGLPSRTHYYSTSGTAATLHGAAGPARRNSSAVLGGFPTDPPFMRSAVIANRRPTVAEYAALLPPPPPLTPHNSNMGRHRREQTVSDSSGSRGAKTGAVEPRTGSFNASLSVPGIFRSFSRRLGEKNEQSASRAKDTGPTEPSA